ncbi:MAG TPA: mechanosensitive ion channel domain-containing protein [Noviherbaspirillum sp.]|nr:mechanosensitive ion channel domain-containing protein [Noviherbaspirillum sp.]
MTERMPDWLLAIVYLITPWIVLIRGLPWISVLVQVLIALPVALLVHAGATAMLRRLAAPLPYSRQVVDYAHGAGGLLFFLLLVQIILRNAPPHLTGLELARHLNAVAMVITLTWLGVCVVRGIAHAIVELHPADAIDNFHARRIQTQTKVLARSVMVLIVLIGTASALMTLPLLRQVGTSLLASAGVAGLVLGFAAKPVLGNLLAGLQIALTQPIRLDDVVIINNEWGQIEEITGTYVVVRIWDQRRLVVPLQWFIENPFQNWTRRTSDILGTVFLWVDYRMPLDVLRTQAQAVCTAAPEWDGRLCLIQVVDTNERAMQLRVLVSAADAGKAWDLRCRLREGLIDFVQRSYPQYLPRLRAEFTATPGPT